jgi:hypothetical protein
MHVAFFCDADWRKALLYKWFDRFGGRHIMQGMHDFAVGRFFEKVVRGKKGFTFQVSGSKFQCSARKGTGV